MPFESAYCDESEKKLCLVEKPVLSDKYTLKLVTPPVDDFLQLRESVGWGRLDKHLASVSLNNSLFHVTIFMGEQLVAMGRVVGDDAMYFYIQDVIVAPTCQKQGLGAVVMNEIEAYLFESAKKGATIGLLSAQGKESFYGHYGYTQRPNSVLGHGMCKFV